MCVRRLVCLCVCACLCWYVFCVLYFSTRCFCGKGLLWARRRGNLRCDPALGPVSSWTPKMGGFPSGIPLKTQPEKGSLKERHPSESCSFCRLAAGIQTMRLNLEAEDLAAKGGEAARGLPGDGSHQNQGPLWQRSERVPSSVWASTAALTLRVAERPPCCVQHELQVEILRRPSGSQASSPFSRPAAPTAQPDMRCSPGMASVQVYAPFGWLVLKGEPHGSQLIWENASDSGKPPCQVSPAHP